VNEQGLTSHQTHYRSHQGHAFTGQMSQNSVKVTHLNRVNIITHIQQSGTRHNGKCHLDHTQTPSPSIRH